MLSRCTALCAAAQLAAAADYTVNKTSVTFPAGADASSYRITFYNKGTIRIQTLIQPGNTGDFTHTTPTGIIVPDPAAFDGTAPTVAQSDNVYTVNYDGDSVTVTRDGATTRFSVNGKVQDLQLVYDAKDKDSVSGANRAVHGKVRQTIKSQSGEKFYGLGMSGASLNGKVANAWNLADAPQPTVVTNDERSKAPYFMSSAGYSVLNNVWNAGVYDFSKGPAVTLNMTADDYTLIDTFVFDADTPAGLVDKYTYLTGRPFMIPVYGLQLGGSDCFHNERHNWHSSSSIAILDKYEDLDIPYGWYQYDDGYGCGIADDGHDNKPAVFDINVVKKLGDEFVARGVKPGIWAAKSSGLGNFSKFVSEGNMSVTKTDVAWVGSGFKYAFDNVEDIAQTMEASADIRRFIWTVCGWAGTHKNAVMWSGDCYGGGAYAKAQVTWYSHAALTGMATVSGDLDGIFGGSQKTMVRDIQMKTFMPVLMTMSGWGLMEKEVFQFQGAITGIMRAWLQLKSQLTPYQYTLSYQATQSGLGITRPMLIDFPEDPMTWETNAFTMNQFMSGSAFLVATDPLGEGKIDQIYLPGKDFLWYEFTTNFWRPQQNVFGNSIPKWAEGIKAGSTLKDVTVPLEAVPIFVKEGAIVPMWWRPQRHVKDVNLEKMPLLVTIWAAPEETATVTSGEFVLYEDDGVTQAYRKGESTMTAISWARTGPEIKVTIQRASNSTKTPAFTGAPATRDIILQFPVITKNNYTMVDTMTQTSTGSSVQGRSLKELGSLNSLEYYPEGWILRSGIYTPTGLHVKLGSVSTDEGITVLISETA